MKIKIIENGPILLDAGGEVEIRSASGSEKKNGPIYLCRCGQSANKPFCDSTHRKVKFEGKSGELSCP